MFEKIKRKTCVRRVFIFIFTKRLFIKILLTKILFFFPIFTTFYRIGNVFINVSFVFALDTQCSLNKVCVVNLSVFYEKLPLSS